jgi:hypothetical protein
MPPGSPNRAPLKRYAAFPEPSFHYLSQFTVNRPLPRFPNGTPMETPIHRTFYTHPLKIHLSLRVPGKVAPPPHPNRVPMDRDTSSPEPLVCLFMYVQRVPKKEPSYKMGKNIRSLSTEPHADGRPSYNGVPPGSPRGSLTLWRRNFLLNFSTPCI